MACLCDVWYWERVRSRFPGENKHLHHRSSSKLTLKVLLRTPPPFLCPSCLVFSPRPVTWHAQQHTITSSIRVQIFLFCSNATESQTDTRHGTEEGGGRRATGGVAGWLALVRAARGLDLKCLHCLPPNERYYLLHYIPLPLPRRVESGW